MRRLEGFSLAELILVIIILGILGALVGPVAYNAIRAYDRLQTTASTNAKVRYAMERIARELRDVRRQATNATFLDIPSMTASSLAFFKTDGTNVVLNGVGGVVNLAYGGVNGVLTDQVQPGSFSLAYFQQNASTVAASAASVAFIQISMTIVEGGGAFPSRLRVDLRNPQ